VDGCDDDDATYPQCDECDEVPIRKRWIAHWHCQESAYTAYAKYNTLYCSVF
jgi:hypothetical protein